MTREAQDRAAVAIGVVSVLSAGFVVVRGDLELVRMRSGGVVVALALGLLAILAGWLANRWLTLAAGVGFLVAAAVLLALLSRGGAGFLQGDGSTFSLWLGLGAGLTAMALPTRDDPSTFRGAR